MNWSSEQILALAPDAASGKAGQGLGVARKWVMLGSNQRALWGECQGSGKDPYRTVIDIDEPAFKCSCPSRKFPCKHALGLFLLYAAQPSALTEGSFPAWVAEWLQKRDAQKQRKETPERQEDDPEARAKKDAAKEKRAVGREEKVAAGLGDLELWLRDLVRQGLAAPQIQNIRYWESMAARMIDAQAPGIARILRDMSSIPTSGEGWSERLLARLGTLYLLLEGYRRIATLPPPVQSDIRTAIGWTHKEEDLLAERGVHDVWLVLGQRTYDEERLRVQRTWLWGTNIRQGALVLDFAMKNQPLDVGFVPGVCFDAELVFYPSSYPLRAAIRSRQALPVHPAPSFYSTIDSFLSAQAEALANNPWLETLPLPLESALPINGGSGYLVRDDSGGTLPVASGFERGWRLLALSGGRPVSLFGEWDGRALLPLSVWSEEKFYRL